MSDEEATRTCTFYDPHKEIAEKQHLVSGSVNPYDDHFPYHACWNPKMGATATTPQECQFVANQPACAVYEAERVTMSEWRVIKRVDGGFQHFVLDQVRFGMGIGEYRILTWNQAGDEPIRALPDDVVVIATMNTMKKPEAPRQIRQLFFFEIGKVLDAYEDEPRPDILALDPNPEPRSLVGTLVPGD